MKLFVLLTISAILLISGLVACTPTATIPPVSASGVNPVRKTMQPFKSEQALRDYLKALAAKQAARRRAEAMAYDSAVSKQGATPAPQSVAKEAQSKAKDGEESITNVQTAGVDEGGIVKLHGNYLVVLRRGRLFTVAVGDNSLVPISSADAFGPEINPNSTWYDEMLIANNTVVVIGYSYERGGTEVGLFSINQAGKLAYQSTYHLRSNDYYSSRNYASRLIGNKLIFYSPLYIQPGADDPAQQFPAVRKWRKGAKDTEFQRIVSANRIYRPEIEFDIDYTAALHTVTVCDLSNGGFNCQATSVLGPAGRVFYVSGDSVYVWAASWYRSGKDKGLGSLLFRMPLDGSGPSALRVSGSPVDQFSFLQSEDEHLNVLVRSGASGDTMWDAEATNGDVALMRISVGSFSDGSEHVPASSYRKLQKPSGYTFQNRFVSDYLIYGTGSSWGAPPQNNDQANLFLVRWKRGDSHLLQLPHGVDRIEQMGSDAVIVGADGKDLHFSSIKLADWPEVVSRYTRKGASQGELRSHGFFYKASNNDSGTLGLPISVPGRAGYRHLFEDSAAILFLKNDSLQFREVGELGARPEKAVNDHCRASCVDWYGNARPLFFKGRIFALLGYEIVEGTLDDGRMRELRRVNYFRS